MLIKTALLKWLSCIFSSYYVFASINNSQYQRSVFLFQMGKGFNSVKPQSRLGFFKIANQHWRLNEYSLYHVIFVIRMQYSYWNNINFTCTKDLSVHVGPPFFCHSPPLYLFSLLPRIPFRAWIHLDSLQFRTANNFSHFTPLAVNAGKWRRSCNWNTKL